MVEADTLEGHGVDGVGNLKKLISEHGDLPETIEQLSPTDSRHLFFINPPGVKIPTRTGQAAEAGDRCERVADRVGCDNVGIAVGSA